MTLVEALSSGNILDVARCYVAQGISVIPIKTDGSKSPAYTGWRAFAKRLPTDAELVSWFANGRVGIGAVAGPASGNLVVLDFENKYDRNAYSEWISTISSDLAEFVPEFPLVRTPSGGRHLWIRINDPESGGKLSRYANGTTKIEVRGEGHQVLAPGCPPECHSSKQTYEFECMGWLL